MIGGIVIQTSQRTEFPESESSRSVGHIGWGDQKNPHYHEEMQVIRLIIQTDNYAEPNSPNVTTVTNALVRTDTFLKSSVNTTWYNF